MFDLPRDLEEEVLSRVPVSSLRSVRFTCKKWNTLSKRRSFAKKHLCQSRLAAARKREFMVVMMMEFKVYLMSVNLHNNFESCMKSEAKLISLDDSHQIDVSQVFHCDGLLLCVSKDNTRLVVWNPYSGQTRWIEPTHDFHRLDLYRYALGYKKSSSKSCRRHKILRFVHYGDTFVESKIYDIKSDSWRVLDITPDCRISYFYLGVSLKGNTYWFAHENGDSFLVSFDFTRERFGKHLPVPFEWFLDDTIRLSSVRDEQLVVLIQSWDTFQVEIWVTTEINPNKVSWSSNFFLSVNMQPLTVIDFQFPLTQGSFFIDEEKKVAVVLDKDNDICDPTRNIAYIVAQDGSFKEEDLGESSVNFCKQPLVCSYVPSLVQIN